MLSFVIPEAGLPEIFDFAGNPSYPESRSVKRKRPWIPDRSLANRKPSAFGLA